MYPTPSAPPMQFAMPYHVCPTVEPAEVITTSGPIPDRVVRESITRSVINGNIDGHKIVMNEHHAAVASQSIAENISTVISARVQNANRVDRVDDLGVSTVTILEPATADSLSDEAPYYAFGQQKLQGEKGYHFSTYQSQYDSREYEVPEYSSMYD